MWVNVNLMYFYSILLFMNSEKQEPNRKEELLEKKYPLCTNCSNELFIIRKNKNIELYCINCSSSCLLSIDDQVVNSLFQKNNFKMTKSVEIRKCSKCKKKYCPYCFFTHKDILTSTCVEDEFNNYEIKDINKHIFNPKETFTNYSIKCEKCNRQYLSGILYQKEKKEDANNIKININKAKDYLNGYYTKIKNELINEIQKKIKIIEESYYKNYNYHLYVFEIIENLLFFEKNNGSKIISRSLENFSNFDYPKISLDYNTLDEKIKKVNDFYQNQFIISENTSDKEKFYTNFRVAKLFGAINVCILGNKLAHNTGRSIDIYDLHDFSLDFVINFERATDIIPLNDETLLIRKGTKVFSCYLKQQDYKIKKIFPLNKELVSLSYMAVLKDKILFNYENRGHNKSGYKILFLSNKFPFKALNSFNVPDSIHDIYGFNDGGFLISLKTNDDKNMTLVFFNQKGEEEKRVELKYYYCILEIIEIEEKLFFQLYHKVVIYGLKTDQIETNFNFNERVISVKKSFSRKNWVCFVFKSWFCIYDINNLQQVFWFEHYLPYITNYLLLNNGTLLGLYDLKLEIVGDRQSDYRLYFNDFESSSLICDGVIK